MRVLDSLNLRACGGMRRILAGLIGLALAVMGSASAVAGPKRVVATFSILGDLAAQIGGDQVVIRTLVTADQDAHAYQPRPSDIQALGAADVVFANGLGFEPWLDKAVAASATHAPVVIVSQGVAARRLRGGVPDPHAWQNVANTKLYVATIARTLSAVDPEHAALYGARARRYQAELDRLDNDIRAQLNGISGGPHIVVTNHDAFGYFGDAYGVRFLAPIGLSTAQEPSAHDVAKLITQIKTEHVRAVFVENLDDPRLIGQIARETGAKVGPSIYSDALSPQGSVAATYVALMRHNLKAFMDGLK